VEDAHGSPAISGDGNLSHIPAPIWESCKEFTVTIGHPLTPDFHPSIGRLVSAYESVIEQIQPTGAGPPKRTRLTQWLLESLPLPVVQLRKPEFSPIIPLSKGADHHLSAVR